MRAAKWDPRPRGCTPLGTPKRRSEASAAKRTQYYCPFLTPPNLPPLLSRVFPRTPAAINLPLDCRGRIYAARQPAATSRSPLPLRRGRACPARDLAQNPFHGQPVGEGFIPPAHFPPPQTATAARGLAALHPQLKNPAPLRGVGDAAPYDPCRKSAAVSHPAPPSVLHILYKLYRSHTKPGTSLQKLYRDCTAPWSIPARKCGTMALLPVKHCEMHKLYHINLVKRESTHT